MTNTYFSSASDAGSFMIKLLRSDYFQDFSAADRINDSEIYLIEAEMTHSYASEDHDAGDYYWGDQAREALTLFGKATPAERAEIFELWG